MKRFAKGEALAAADMNQIAVAIENLQDTPRGGQHVRQGHATYGLAWFTDELQAPGVLAGVKYTIGIDAPRITDGLMELPPPGGGGGCDCVLAQYNNSSVDDVAGKLAGVKYTIGIDAPRVTDGMMELPLAEYENTGSTSVDDAGHAGGVLGICYGSSIDAPRISGGMIELVEPTIEQYSATVPEDGADGWVLSAYMPMIMASDGSGDLLVSFRQLMRVHNGKLQVNFQRAIAPTGAWENYFNG